MVSLCVALQFTFIAPASILIDMARLSGCYGSGQECTLLWLMYGSDAWVVYGSDQGVVKSAPCFGWCMGVMLGWCLRVIKG
eukprot:724688-Pelagomonas_calceolata.AAC.7